MSCARALLPTAALVLTFLGVGVVADAAAQAPTMADDSEVGAYERDAVAPTLDAPAPPRLRRVDPVWPSPSSERWRFRVHLVLDATGQVAESRLVLTLAGDPAARPMGPHGDVDPAFRTSSTARAGLAVLGAVRQWRFAPPPRAPMLLVVDVDSEETGVPPGVSGEREPLRVGGTLPPPRKLLDVPPVYPPEAIVARITGVVTIEALINVAGEVQEARVVSGTPMLDNPALAAVRQWRYTPTLLNGEPVPVVMTVTVRFSLSK